MKETNESSNFEQGQNIVIGRNAVKELLVSGRSVESLVVSTGDQHGAILGIIAKYRGMGIPIKTADQSKLNKLSNGLNHQGIIAIASDYEYAELDDILQRAKDRGEPAFIVIAEEIEDPHNLGAIIRTAECVGAHGVIIPKRRAVGVNSSVTKASAGATEHMRVSRVTNISATIEKLKKLGIWLYAADMHGTNWCNEDLTGPVGLVIGSEGHGVSRLVKENCDKVISLPILGKVNSLNASVAAGILMYEVRRQRGLR